MTDLVVVFADGGSRGNPGPSAIGAVVIDPSTTPPTRLAAVSERIGVTTNNVAEYKALIAGLQAAQEFSPRIVHVRADSKLVVEQLAGRWKVKQPHLKPLHAQAKALLDTFAEIDLAHVPREQNTEADALVNAALDLPDSLRPDSLRPDSLRPDSLRPDSLRPDSLWPDSLWP